MKKQLFFLSYLFLLTAGLLSAQTPTPLITFLSKENLLHAAISFKAVDMHTGKVIASHNENMALTPASNMKIVTTATALEILGADFYFETPLLYDGIIQNNLLTGNLYIRGVGDPTLGSEFMPGDKEIFLKEWLHALNRVGIQKVSGDIVVLDHLFGYEGVSPKWLWEDMGTYYAPGVYGISVFDNMYRAYLQPSGTDNGTRVLYTEPPVKDLQLTNEIKVSGDSTDDVSAFGLPFSNEMRLYGTIPDSKTSVVVKGAIPDPGLFLADYFHDYLQKNGIVVEGKALTCRLHPIAPGEKKELGAVRSADLASIVRGINVRSDNQYAEHIYKVLTVLDSVDIPGYWREKGLDVNALFMYDGCGVSPKNAISSGFLIDLLVYMDKKYGKSDAFYRSLPIAGEEGTVASLLRNTSLRGKARLKSGSVMNVQSYSGYIENKGKRYAVSLIINNFTGKRTDLRKAIEQLFVALF